MIELNTMTFATSLRQRIADSRLSMREIGKRCGVNNTRISQLCAGRHGKRYYFPKAALLQKLAGVIAPRIPMPVQDLVDEWSIMLQRDKMDRHAPAFAAVLKSGEIDRQIHAPAIKELIQYAQTLLDVTGINRSYGKMHYIPLSQVAGLEPDVKAFVTENPKISITPSATHAICAAEPPHEGQWCLIALPDGSARADVYAPALAALGVCHRILTFIQV